MRLGGLCVEDPVECEHPASPQSPSARSSDGLLRWTFAVTTQNVLKLYGRNYQRNSGLQINSLKENFGKGGIIMNGGRCWGK